MAGRFGDECNKGLVGNRNSVGSTDDGVRVLEEKRIFGEVEANKSNGVGRSGSSGLEGKVWDNDFMLEMIGMDLDWRYGPVEKEVTGGVGSRNGREINRVGDLNLWRENVGKATNRHGICIKGSTVEGLDSMNPACPLGVNVLRGRQDSIVNEMVPSLKSLANTFNPDKVLHFVNSAATHPSRTSFLAEKGELTSFNRWRGRRNHPSFEEFGELVDEEKGERGCDREVNNIQSNNKRPRGRPPKKRKM